MVTKMKKRILIVEDDIFLVKAYTMRFEKEGFEVMTAGDADSVRPLFAQTPPDAILLDIMLPGTSGFELLQEIKKQETWKNVPVVIVSNLSQDRDIALGKKLGATDYIVKADTKISDIINAISVNTQK